MAKSTHEFVDRQTKTRARAEGVPPAAGYRQGSTDGEVAWWWVDIVRAVRWWVRPFLHFFIRFVDWVVAWVGSETDSVVRW